MKQTPVVLDGRYVYAYTAYYGIAAVWGIVAGINGLLPISETGGPLIESLWPLAVGIVSTILFTFTFAAGKIENYTDILTARVEKHFTLLWIAIVSALPVAVIYQFVVEADVSRAASSVSTFLYLVFPVARWIYLTIRAKKKRNG